MGSIMGGGGAPEIPQRNLQDETSQLADLLDFGKGQYRQFTKDDPILKALYGQATDYLSSPTSPILQEMQSSALERLQAGGQLTQEEQLATKRQADEYSQAHGTFFNPSTVATEALTSDIYSRQKYAEALGQASGVEGLTQASTAQQFALPESVVNTSVGAYTGLTNPLIAYASDLFGGNQSAAADEAIAGANKSSGASSGVMSTIGSVAGAVGMAY